MQTLCNFLVLGDALKLSDAYWYEDEEASSNSPKRNYVLYKHLRTHTGYFKVYGKRAHVHEFSITR